MTQASEQARPPAPTSKAAQAILEVAEQVFAERGFGAASINDIALGAGVSKANIFHHFKSKEGLYMAVLQMACEHAAQALDEVEDGLADGPKARLSGFSSRHLQALLAHPQSTRLIQHELLEGGSERGRRLAEEVFAGHFSRLVALVREGQASGALRDDFAPELLAVLLVGSNVFFFESQAVLRHLPGVDFADAPQHYSSAVFDLLSRGFTATNKE